MLSPQERDQKRLERARLRAERKSTYKGLTKEEALRIGNASNKFRDDRKQQQQQEIEFLSPQEKERRRLEFRSCQSRASVIADSVKRKRFESVRLRIRSS